MSEHKREPIEATIAELKPGMKSVNITFKVLSTSEEREVESRRDNETYHVVDAVVGDSTATVMMPVWNEAIKAIKDDETYTLTNGYTGLFKGSLRLHMGKFGTIAAAAEPITKVNEGLDMSAKDHSGGPRSL